MSPIVFDIVIYIVAPASIRRLFTSPSEIEHPPDLIHHVRDNPTHGAILVTLGAVFNGQERSK